MNDKIREEFEKEFIGSYDQIHRTYLYMGFKAGYKSRDQEFKGWETLADVHNEEIFNLTSRVAVAEGKNVELENDCKNLVQINKNQSSNMNNWQEDIADLVTENKKLREALINLMKGVQGLPPLTAIQGTLEEEWQSACKLIEKITDQKWEEINHDSQTNNV